MTEGPKTLFYATIFKLFLEWRQLQTTNHFTIFNRRVAQVGY